MVLAGIECSQKSLIFANGIPVQERVDFFGTLNVSHTAGAFFAKQKPKKTDIY